MTQRDETQTQNRGLIVSRVVEALRAGRGATNDELAEAAGLKRSTYFTRLKDGKWSFAEVSALAEYLDEPITSFIDGLGGRFVEIPPQQRRRAANTRDEAAGDTHRFELDLPVCVAA